MRPEKSPSRRPRDTLLLAVTLCLTIGSILRTSRLSYSGRRSLQVSTSSQYLHETHSTLPPWAHFHLVSIHEPPNPAQETPLFWHIPKSGGTTAKGLYGDCIGLTLATRVGADPRFGHENDLEIQVFSPYDQHPEAKVVNVDVTTEKGILRAKEMGLARSKKAGMIFTSDINFASQNLFDPSNRGRVLVFFRHPVDRSVSKFYYLQIATWERTYRPQWKDLSLLEWATKHNIDENHMVKKILGKKLRDPVDFGDLIVAKEIVRNKFFVGLMNDMEESVKRFNVILGIDNNSNKTKQCMSEYFGSREIAPKGKSVKSKTVDGSANQKAAEQSSQGKNSNAHPKVVEGSPEWELLAERNSLDMILYNYALLLYNEQKSIIDEYAKNSIVSSI